MKSTIFIFLFPPSLGYLRLVLFQQAKRFHWERLPAAILFAARLIRPVFADRFLRCCFGGRGFVFCRMSAFAGPGELYFLVPVIRKHVGEEHQQQKYR